MSILKFGIVGVIATTLSCVRAQPSSVVTSLQSKQVLLPADPLPKIILNCKHLTVNPVIGEGGRVVRYSIELKEKDPHTGNINGFIEAIGFRKLTHDLGQGFYAYHFSFKAPGQETVLQPMPRVTMNFGISAEKRLSLTFSLVEKNEFGVIEAEDIPCTLFYEPSEGSQVKVVEMDRYPKDLLAFKELSNGLTVGATKWDQSTLTFTSPKDFYPSSSDKVLVLQDASGLPIGVFEDGVKKGQGGMKILGPMVIRKIPSCFSPKGPPLSEPKKTIHGFEVKTK